jgi:ABC-type phosphate transport system permease subunit
VSAKSLRIAVNNLAGVSSDVFGVFGLGFFVDSRVLIGSARVNEDLTIPSLFSNIIR